MSGLRVLAAMSGGVDSATAAARAADAGHEVTGCTSRCPLTVVLPDRGAGLLHPRGLPGRPAGRGRHRHPVLRLGPGRALPRRSGGLRRRVRGGPHTQPVPALQREDQVRGGARQGAGPRLRRGCTGHYAQIRDGPAPRRGPGKDQSYVLAVLTPSSSPTPCSRSATPPRTRSAPRQTARPGRREEAGQPRHLLHRRRRHPGLPGPQLGRPPARSSTSPVPPGDHDGAYAFTVGQRKGLRIGTPAHDGKPRYVLDIEPVTNTVTVGPAEGLDVTEITATRPVWSGCRRPRRPSLPASSAPTARCTPAPRGWRGRPDATHPPA